MSSSYNGLVVGAPGDRGAATKISPPRPHWRSRDTTATIVYVVHPAQFRDVVQQLTGVSRNKTASQPRCYAAASRTADEANVAALAPRDGGGYCEVIRDPDCDSTPATTLRQMLEECMAWATSD
ncbi:unnamed protein product [Alopecurus aequalis]